MCSLFEPDSQVKDVQVVFLFHMTPLRSYILLLLFSLVTCVILIHLFLNPYSDVIERMKRYIYYKFQPHNKKTEP